MIMQTNTQTKATNIPWLGDIPEGWEVRRLKNSVKLNQSNAKSNDLKIALENIESWTGKFIQSENKFEGEGVEFEKEDVLFGKLRPYLAKVLIPKSDGWCVNEILVLKPNTEIISQKFLYLILSNSSFINIVDSSTYGSKMPRASWDFIGSIFIPLPPLQTQTAIVEFLDKKMAKISELVSNKKKLIELLQEQKKSLIYEAVTGKIKIGNDCEITNNNSKPSGIPWLGDIPEGWKVNKLKKIGKSITGLTYDPKEIITDIDSGILVLRSSNVQNGKITLDNNVFVSKEIPKNLLVKKGDILICSRNGSINLIGKCAVIDEVSENMTFGAFMTIFRSEYNKYLRYFFNSDLFKQQMSVCFTTTINQLTIGILNEMLIPLPPIPTQTAIVEYLDSKTAKINQTISTIEQELELIEEYKKSLIYQAVTGKIEI